MPKFPKPFFRSSRNAWYVQLDKQQIKLHEDEAEAFRLYHELMAARPKRATKTATGELTVAEVFDRYLSWCEQHRAANTYEGHKAHIQRFCSAVPQLETMPVSGLKPFHITEFVDRHKTWGASFRRQTIQAVQRPFSWAEKLGMIEKSPVRHIEKPAAQRREQSVSPVEWEKIRDHYQDGDDFRDILEFLWETGCRPQEAKRLEVRHLELGNHRAVFPKDEAKGKRRIRVIVLTPRAEEIIRRRLPETGLVFTNENGGPWTGYSMNCRFQRLKKTLGIKYAAYSLRHGFADRMLMNNTDCMTLAALMGHVGTEMLTKHYSALDRQTGYLHKQLNRNASA